MTEEEFTDRDNLRGFRDPLFIDALRVCITERHASTALIDGHLHIGYGRAAAILDAMDSEGFIGEREGTPRVHSVLISSIEELEQRICDKQQLENDERDAFREELTRLLTNGGTYVYVEQFAKKFGRNINLDEMSKLRELLHVRGFEFSSEQITDVIDLAVRQQRRRNAKSKILSDEPNGAGNIIKVYLNFYRANDDEMREVLQEILEEKNLFGLFKNNGEALRAEVERVQKEIELDNFEKRLLSNEAFMFSFADLDNLSGYEFESFLSDLFSKMGFTVIQTPLSGDQGADIVVVKFGEKTVIQAKRFEGKVGNSAVQEIMASINFYQAQNGMVITNSYFTPAARELAKSNNIELVDRDGLQELISKYW